MKNPACEQGIILLTTLMMLSLLALISLYEWQFVFLNIKINHQHQIQQRLFYQMEDFIGEALRKRENCQMKESDANTVLSLLEEGRGCRQVFKGESYDFIVEDLGAFPCLRIYQRDESYASKHLRVSIRSTSGILQIRLALLGDKKAKCFFKETFISRGILSWRYIGSGMNFAGFHERTEHSCLREEVWKKSQ